MTSTSAASSYDAIIVGGSYAGLAAAIILARARRRLLVVDAGQRRNRFAAASHGFLGQDGQSPAQIASLGRRQLLAYPDVNWLPGKATTALRQAGGFRIQVDDGLPVDARALVLATGVTDELPDIDGLAARWGRHVFHCPYCHAFELNQGSIGVIASGEVSMHQALMLPDWGQVTLFTNGSFEPDQAQTAALDARGVRVERARIAAIVHEASIHLVDGREMAMAGLFVAPRLHQASPLAAQLGCRFETGPMGDWIATDEVKATSEPGIFACGDAARMAGNVALAVGDGTLAGLSAHRWLMAA